jgi:hypothetical protein
VKSHCVQRKRSLSPPSSICGTQESGDPQHGQKRYSVMLEILL